MNSSYDQSLQDVVRLNNLGASYITMENFPSAISFLSEALRLTRIAARIGDRTGSLGCNLKKNRLTLDHCMAMSKAYHNDAERLRRGGRPLSYTVGDCNSDHADASFVFSQPIFLPEDSKAHLDMSKNMGELSAITVFNLALSYQLLSAVGPSYGCTAPRSYLLRKAIAFYDIGCKLLIVPEPQAGDTAFALAVSNNLVHAYQVLREYGAAERYSHFLLLFLLARSFSGWDNGISNEMAGFFFGTVLHLVFQRHAPAAAA